MLALQNSDFVQKLGSISSNAGQILYLLQYVIEKLPIPEMVCKCYFGGPNAALQKQIQMETFF